MFQFVDPKFFIVKEKKKITKIAGPTSTMDDGGDGGGDGNSF